MINLAYINLDLLKLWWLDKKNLPQIMVQWWFTVVESIKHHLKQTKKAVKPKLFLFKRSEMWWSNGPQLATVTLRALPWSSSKAFSNWPFWDAWSGRNVASTKHCYKLGPWQTKISELSPKVSKFILYFGSMYCIFTYKIYKLTIQINHSCR